MIFIVVLKPYGRGCKPRPARVPNMTTRIPPRRYTILLVWFHQGSLSAVLLTVDHLYNVRPLHEQQSPSQTRKNHAGYHVISSQNNNICPNLDQK